MTNAMDRDYMVDIANQIPFVLWDRCVIYDDYDDNGWSHAALYGWCPDPESDRSDFVVLQFWTMADGTSEWNWITSSTRLSPIINEMHSPGSEHNDCQPVQLELPNLHSMVHREAFHQ